ncbi:type 1 fimbrial protein [Vibrio cholerae]|uniref:fimbrial protein n=1 Tax=Vibrio cholerae TaxID=666 RepID=UPI0018F08027|nr:fimbrial protein [Vibrio cholerae]EKE6106986.1 type 1 fimbrial protein [Vibrio cholerae]ELF5324215.1 type 1 fimbrial protein [Vibrio cholerae]MBJ6887611.1 type 1 fimbrial protein [Vibrio cholerae]HDZ9221852.1 type 1 fimbrial protein [Vibrio cholerae]
MMCSSHEVAQAATRCKTWRKRWVAALPLWLPFCAVAGSQELIMTITAEVVGQPCSLRPGDEIIPVDFGNINNKDLLRDGRTPSRSFQLHLDECDPSIADSVSVTFSGVASEESALLALSAGSQAKGIAIGLEQGGQALPINQPSRAFTLAEGSNVLDFAAYVQLLPSAQTGVTPGNFNATANFTLDYD